MSGMPGFLLMRRVVRASYTLNGRPMTDEQRKEFDAKLEKMERRLDEAMKGLRP